MAILLHTYEINKTYILVYYLSFDDNMGEIKPVLGGQTWSTTFYYLATLSAIFALICLINLILNN